VGVKHKKLLTLYGIRSIIYLFESLLQLKIDRYSIGYKYWFSPLLSGFPFWKLANYPQSLLIE
jgi:hypothetical protein